MYPDHASIRPDTRLAPGQRIALFLMRLANYMARLSNTPHDHIPHETLAYLTSMVTAAEGLVHAFVRMLTAEKLKRLGYVELANAMRCRGEVEPGLPVQACTPQTDLAQLNERLQTTLSDFDEAELLASHLACMIVLAISYRPLEPYEPLFSRTSCEITSNEPTRAVSPALPPVLWPPPLQGPPPPRLTA